MVVQIALEPSLEILLMHVKFQHETHNIFY
jgi:hypothetical protein